jgi:hypothetical protein
MKLKALVLLIVLVNILFGSNTFTTSDPPMIYIHHFVSYDSTFFLWNEKTITESQPTSPISNTRIQTQDNLILMKQIHPKIVSAMVTSSLAKYKQMKIAGESIQNRISTVNVLELVKESSYPQETDFVMIGELNVVGGGQVLPNSQTGPSLNIGGLQFEIDLKVLDVSTQDILSSVSISIPFDQLNTIRSRIESTVDEIMADILNPFTSSIILYADSTSIGKIAWNTLTIRQIRTKAAGKVIETTDKDIEMVSSTSFETLNYSVPEYALKAGSTPKEYRYIFSNFGRKMTGSFLQGDYKINVQLIGYEKADNYEQIISVIALRNEDFAIELIPPPPAPPLPPPPPPIIGDIRLDNLQNGLEYEIYYSSDSTHTERIITGYYENDEIKHTLDNSISSVISNSKKSVIYKGLPKGEYVINTFGRAEESFPGKQYVTIYSYTDTVTISSSKKASEIKIPTISKFAGREVIIYFNPFPVSENEEYRLYVDESNVPFTVISVVGELHIMGVSEDFSGSFRIIRDGFENAVIPIMPGSEKSYLIANLTTPRKMTSPNKEKVSFGSFLK